MPMYLRTWRVMRANHPHMRHKGRAALASDNLAGRVLEGKAFVCSQARTISSDECCICNNSSCRLFSGNTVKPSDLKDNQLLAIKIRVQADSLQGTPRTGSTAVTGTMANASTAQAAEPGITNTQRGWDPVSGASWVYLDYEVNIVSVVISPDSRTAMLLTPALERMLFTWDLQRAHALSRLQVPHDCHAAFFSADSQTFVVFGEVTEGSQRITRLMFSVWSVNNSAKLQAGELSHDLFGNKNVCAYAMMAGMCLSLLLDDGHLLMYDLVLGMLVSEVRLPVGAASPDSLLANINGEFAAVWCSNDAAAPIHVCAASSSQPLSSIQCITKADTNLAAAKLGAEQSQPQSGADAGVSGSNASNVEGISGTGPTPHVQWSLSSLCFAGGTGTCGCLLVTHAWLQHGCVSVIRVWEVASGSCLRCWTADQELYGMMVAPMGLKMAVLAKPNPAADPSNPALSGAQLAVVDLPVMALSASGEQSVLKFSWIEGCSNGVSSWSASDNCLASISESNLWEVRLNRIDTRGLLLNIHQGADSVQWSPDGTKLVFRFKDTIQVGFMDLQPGCQISQAALHQPIMDSTIYMCTSRHGDQLLVCASDGSISCYDTAAVAQQSAASTANIGTDSSQQNMFGTLANESPAPQYVPVRLTWQSRVVFPPPDEPHKLCGFVCTAADIRAPTASHHGPAAIAVISQQGMLQCLDPTTGRPTLQPQPPGLMLDGYASCQPSLNFDSAASSLSITLATSPTDASARLHCPLSDTHLALLQRLCNTDTFTFSSTACHLPSRVIVACSSSSATLLLLRLSSLTEGSAIQDLSAIPLPLSPVSHTSITCCCISPDGQLAVAGCSDGRYCLIDFTWKDMKLYAHAHYSPVAACCFMPHGASFLTLGADGMLCQWRVPQGLSKAMKLREAKGQSCSFSPDGRWLAVAGKVLDAADGRVLAACPSDQPVACSSWSPDGTQLASAAGSHIVLWEPGVPATKAMQAEVASGGMVTACCWNADAKVVVTGDDQGWVKLWKLSSDGISHASKLHSSLASHKEADAISCIQCSRGCKLLMYGTKGGTMAFCTSDLKSQLLREEGLHGGGVRCCCFSSGAGSQNALRYVPRLMAASCGDDGTVTVRDLDSAQVVFLVTAHIGSANGCAFSYTGAWLATVGWTDCKIWETASGALLYVIRGGGSPTSCSFSPDDGLLALTTAYDGAQLHRLFVHTPCPPHPAQLMSWHRACPAADRETAISQLVKKHKAHVLLNHAGPQPSHSLLMLLAASDYPDDAALLQSLLAQVADGSHSVGLLQGAINALQLAVNASNAAAAEAIVLAILAGKVTHASLAAVAPVLPSMLSTPQLKHLAYRLLEELALIQQGTFMVPAIPAGSSGGFEQQYTQPGSLVAAAMPGSFLGFDPDRWEVKMQLGATLQQMWVRWLDVPNVPRTQKAGTTISSWANPAAIASRQGLTTAAAQAPGPQLNMTSYCVPLPGITATGRSSLLRALQNAGAPPSVYGLFVVAALVKFKWQLYGKQHASWKAALYLGLTMLYTAFCLLARYQPSDDSLQDMLHDRLGTASVAVGAAVLAAAALGLEVQTRQLRNRELYLWFMNAWNPLEGVAHATMATSVAVHFSRSDAAPLLMAIGTVLVWTRLVFFGLVFESTGPLVRMVISIIYSIRSFLLLLGMVLVAFAVAFFVLIPKSPSDAFVNPARSLLSMYSSMLGGYDLGDYIDSPLDVRWLAATLFTIFQLGVQIILVNLLIAIMSDAYDQVKDNERVQYLKGLAALIDDVEAEHPHLDKDIRRRLQLQFGIQPNGLHSHQKFSHLCVLVRTEDGDPSEWTYNGGEWQGRVKEVELRVTSALQKTEANVSAGMSKEISKQLAELQAIVAKQVADLSSRTEAMQKGMTAMQKQLDAIQSEIVQQRRDMLEPLKLFEQPG